MSVEVDKRARRVRDVDSVRKRLAGDLELAGEFEAENVLIERQDGLEIGDGESNVMCRKRLCRHVSSGVGER